MFESFDTPGAAERWHYFWGNGGAAQVSVVPDPENAARKVGAFNYTHSVDGAGVTMFREGHLPPETTCLILRVNSSGAGEKIKLTARIHDSSGEVFAYEFCDGIDWKGWKSFDIDTSAPSATWGGNNDKKIDEPAGFAFSISGAKAGEGTVLLGAIDAEYRVTDANRYVFAIANDPPGNIFFGAVRDAAVGFTLADRAEETGEFNLESLVYDSDDNLVAHSKQDVKLAAGNKASRFNVPLTARKFGWYRVSATLRKKDGALVDRIETTAAIVPDGIKPSAASPFGMNMRQNAMQIAAKSGVSWTREEFSWERIEPVKGKYNWAPYDTAVKTSRSLGINTLGLLTYSASWARRDASQYTSPPRDVNDYAEFVHAVVSRYKNEVKHWEIWNEPDCNGFWPPNGANADEYAALLKAGYAAAKKADPNCVVMNGGLLAGVCHPDMWGYPEKLFALAPPFDVFAWHPYGDPHSPEAARYTARTKTLLGLLKKNNLPARLWLTEQAWSTGNEKTKSVSETLQAQYIVRGHVLALANPAVEKFIWFLFRDGGGRDHDYEQSYGILNPDGTPKRAYPAYVQMSKMLANRKPVRRVNVAGRGDIFAYSFFDGTANLLSDVTVLWT
ncbi:MAG: beta-galactosidase, partial [Kiritimatiellaeota bacterium]|nr:beta-galactosidase [Kiritimatiellota bacterium]